MTAHFQVEKYVFNGRAYKLEGMIMYRELENVVQVYVISPKFYRLVKSILQ